MKSQNRIRTERNTRNRNKAQAAYATAPQPPGHGYQEQADMLAAQFRTLSDPTPGSKNRDFIHLPVPGLFNASDWCEGDVLLRIAVWITRVRSSLMERVFPALHANDQPAFLELLLVSKQIQDAVAESGLSALTEGFEFDLPFMAAHIGPQDIEDMLIWVSDALYRSHTLIASHFVQGVDPIPARVCLEVLCLAESVLDRSGYPTDVDEGQSPLRAWLKALAVPALLDYMLNENVKAMRTA